MIKECKFARIKPFVFMPTNCATEVLFLLWISVSVHDLPFLYVYHFVKVVCIDSLVIPLFVKALSPMTSCIKAPTFFNKYVALKTILAKYSSQAERFKAKPAIG